MPGIHDYTEDVLKVRSQLSELAFGDGDPVKAATAAGSALRASRKWRLTARLRGRMHREAKV